MPVFIKFNRLSPAKRSFHVKSKRMPSNKYFFFICGLFHLLFIHSITMTPGSWKLLIAMYFWTHVKNTVPLACPLCSLKTLYPCPFYIIHIMDQRWTSEIYAVACDTFCPQYTTTSAARCSHIYHPKCHTYIYGLYTYPYIVAKQ